jgi:uracil-DNA glycosylase family 4
VPPAGDGSSGIMVVLEAPGAEEDAQCIPAVGKSGRLLNSALTKYKRETLTIFNTVNCRPPNNKLTGTDYGAVAIEHCKVHRDRVVRERRPRVFVAMGNTALRTLTGEALNITDHRGYMYPSTYSGIPVVGTYHPAYLLYDRASLMGEMRGKTGMGALHTMIFDLNEKVDVPLDRPKTLYPFINVADMEAMLRHDAPYLAIDTETVRPTPDERLAHAGDIPMEIARASVALRYGGEVHGASFPWTRPFVDVLRGAVQRYEQLVFWNYLFDVPRLGHCGCAVELSRVVDAMWLFHFLYPHLPYNLGHASTYYTGLPEWKSMNNAHPEYYSAMDAYATALVYEGIERDLDKFGMTEIAESHVTQLLKVLQRMGDRGVAIDEGALDAYREGLEAQKIPLEERMNRLEPPSLHRYSPPDGYKNIPKDRERRVTCKNCRGAATVIKKYKNGKRRAVKCGICKGKGYGREMKTDGLSQLPNGRWAQRLPFLATSPPQILAYIVERGLSLTKRGRMPTNADVLVIAMLRNRYPTDPVLPLVMELRKLTKVIGTYANWPLGEDGRVHTEFTLKPESGRLSSVRPNVQNVPQPEDEDDMYAQFRRVIVASPGHKLGSIDYKGIEAVLTGYFAGDDEYMELATKGVHAYATARRSGMSVSPKTFTSELAEQVKREQPSLYKKLKKTNHGINYGEGWRKLFKINPGLFSSEADAKELWEFIRSEIPKVIEWQDRTVKQAFTKHRLTNPYRYQRWFWDPTADGPAAIAQQPQSTAAAIIRAAMLRVDADPITSESLVWQIHDELIFDAPEGVFDGMMRRAVEIMEEPVAELGGLVIRTSSKCGPNLADMEDWG